VNVLLKESTANAAADIGTSVPATRLLELVNLLPHPPSAGLTLLDNACGNLNLSYQFLRRWDGQNGLKEVKAGDNSQEMITHAQNRLKKGELKGLAIDLREWDAHVLTPFAPSVPDSY
jgi:ubiquinone/menaquinone biosynthesis C-methylase UbiE